MSPDLTQKGHKLKQVEKCPVCSGSDVLELAALEKYPFTEKFAEPGSEAVFGEFSADQRLLICARCTHGFLEMQYDPKKLYHSDYKTISSKSQPATQATRQLLEFASDFVPLDHLDLIFDIGANDGSLLRQVSGMGFAGKKSALDPSFSVWDDDVQGFTGFIEDFDFHNLPDVTGYRLFIASHVLEHVSDPIGVIGKIAASMGPKDFLVLQFPALEPLARDRRFDQVHHQHFHYFSWKSFLLLLSITGLRVTKAKVDWNHYGAGNVILRKSGKPDHDLEHNAGTPWLEPRLEKFAAQGFANILRSYEDFTTYQNVLDRCLSEREYVALGAGLMSPIVFYHLPNGWRNCVALFDHDQSKIGQRYANTPRVVSPLPDTLQGLDTLISGSVSKGAGRKLYGVANDLGAKTITFPVLNY